MGRLQTLEEMHEHQRKQVEMAKADVQKRIDALNNAVVALQKLVRHRRLLRRAKIIAFEEWADLTKKVAIGNKTIAAYRTTITANQASIRSLETTLEKIASEKSSLLAAKAGGQLIKVQFRGKRRGRHS